MKLEPNYKKKQRNKIEPVDDSYKDSGDLPPMVRDHIQHITPKYEFDRMERTSRKVEIWIILILVILAMATGIYFYWGRG